VLIRGEVADKNNVLRLRFVTPRDGGAAKPYSLNEKLELPVDFGSDLGAVLAAQAASAISPIYHRSGEALAALIAPLVAKLKPLAENPPASFPDETRAHLWIAYAEGEKRLGEERGDNARLASAIAYYKKALTTWTRDKVPLGWAMTQNNLGNALSTLGERESGTAHLEEAVAAHRETLTEWTREREPLQWAGAQNNLGNALQTLGARESGTARLEEAVAAYREALLEWTRERVPLQWAGTQNNLGNALSTLGERESGTAHLKEAVSAYRAALTEWTRQRVPLQWAMTQNNLGTALQTLGARESGTARLEEAVSAYRAALLEWTRERVPLDWATTQNNLGNALRSLGEREAETDKARGCATLKTARDHLAAALEEFQKADASYYVEGTQGNVAGLDDVIARLCG
jgi:tetratricopeptide (TPR) repeat protein